MKKANWLALLTACVLLSGCNTPPLPQQSNSGVTPPLDPNDTTTYTISLDGNRLEFDAKGNLTKTVGPLESEPQEITDLLTGAPAYRKHTQTEKTGELDEYGSPVVSRTTALYRLDGSVLLDYGAYDYGSALGSDLIIRMDQRDGFWVDIGSVPDDYNSELWNLKTQQPVLPGVYQLEAIDQPPTRFLATNVYNTLLGVVDANGKVVAGFGEPLPYYNASAWNGMILASDQNPFGEGNQKDSRTWLLTPTLEPVLSRRSLIGRSTPGGGYHLRFQNDEGCAGLMDAEGNELYVTSAPKIYINFFDGELLATSQLRKDTDTERIFEHQLTRLDGTIVAQNYQQVIPFCVDNWNLKERPARFVARRGDQIDVLDRAGKVLASRTIAGVDNIDALSTELLTYIIEGEENRNRYGLLDSSLQTLIEPERYQYISLRKAADSDTALITAQLPDPSGSWSTRTDLYDTDLRPVATALTTLGTVGNDRFAAVRGFSAGVMDFNGNWVGSPISIFEFSSDETINEEDYW